MNSLFGSFCCSMVEFLHLMNLNILYDSRAVGYRFGPYLQDTVPLLINYCKSASENDEELREYSLQVLYFICRLSHRIINLFLGVFVLPFRKFLLNISCVIF